MKIQKTSGGQIIIFKYNSTSLAWDIPVVMILSSVSIEKIEINNEILGYKMVDISGFYLSILLEDTLVYEIDPDPEQTFSGSATDLFDLLSTIFNTSSGGGDISSLSKGSGASDSNTLRMVLESTNRNDISSMKSILDLENWDKIPGNSLEFTWDVAPSGNRVVSEIAYKTGLTTILTQTFTYTSPSAGIDEISSIVVS